MQIIFRSYQYKKQNETVDKETKSDSSCTLPQYAKHGDHHHGQLMPEAIYLEAAAHEWKQNMPGLHMFLS